MSDYEHIDAVAVPYGDEEPINGYECAWLLDALTAEIARDNDRISRKAAELAAEISREDARAARRNPQNTYHDVMDAVDARLDLVDFQHAVQNRDTAAIGALILKAYDDVLADNGTDFYDRLRKGAV